MTATAAPLLDCGHPMTNRGGPNDIGTGRAIDADGRTYCYPCAGDHEAEAFAAADAYLAYDTGKPELTTWTGRTLARVTERRTSRNGASHGRWGYGVTYLRARGPDGSEWWGRHSIDCECVTLHRCKGGKA